jgi:centromeric protein E
LKIFYFKTNNKNNLFLNLFFFPFCLKKLIYSFNQIFDVSVTQKQLFEQVGLPLVQDLLLSSKNGLLFTHGLGKTHTMIGSQNEPGILQLALDTLFNSISFQQAKRNVIYFYFLLINNSKYSTNFILC